MILTPDQIAEFSATALVITFRSIRCGYSACRAGWSKAFTPPATNPIAMMCHTLIVSVSVKKPRRKISDVMMIWVKNISLRLSSLSANTPPTRLSAIAADAFDRPTYPRYSAEPVSSYVTHPWVNIAIWNPPTDANVPKPV